MATPTLPETVSLPSDVARIATCILSSLLSGELVLLRLSEARSSILFSMGAIAVLLIALACGMRLAKAVLPNSQHKITYLYWGFLFSFVGLLLIGIVWHTQHNTVLFLFGAVLAGAGQGMAIATLRTGGRHFTTALCMVTAMAISLLAGGMIISFVISEMGLMAGASFIADVSLLGAICCKIAQQSL